MQMPLKPPPLLLLILVSCAGQTPPPPPPSPIQAFLTPSPPTSTLRVDVGWEEPSPTCQEIVSRFASGVSNFTHCSVTNSRPIHLCKWCVAEYLSVQRAHRDLFETIDEMGNPCRDYFTNSDRIQIVSSAYNYVHTLWAEKGHCDNCFLHSPTNGSLLPFITEETTDFILLFEITKSCFDSLPPPTFHVSSNFEEAPPSLKGEETPPPSSANTSLCTKCRQNYTDLNNLYIDLVAKYGDNVCMDIVDTMNTTRQIWSQVLHCNPTRQGEVWLHVGMGFVYLSPLIFYLVTYLLSTKQEARVFQQRRLAEIFNITTSSSSSTQNPRDNTPRQRIPQTSETR